MFVNGSRQNEQSLERTFHRCFIPSFTSFGWGVSEEKIKMWKVNGQTTDAKWWQKITLPLARWAKKDQSSLTSIEHKKNPWHWVENPGPVHKFAHSKDLNILAFKPFLITLSKRYKPLKKENAWLHFVYPKFLYHMIYPRLTISRSVIG